MCIRDSNGTADFAVLELGGDAPTDVTPCPLVDIPAPEGHGFFAYGLTPDSPFPVRTDGHVRGIEGPGGTWVRLEARPGVGPAIQRGYSGAAVWDTDENAAVGIIVARELPTDTRSGFYLPFSKLIDLWPGLADYVATPFERSLEAREHWLPRARGVGSGAERGWHFKGRQVLLDRITASARGIGAKSRQFFCLAGAPGVGKSSVMARLPVLADRHLGRLAAPAINDLRLSGIDVIPIYLRQETYASVVRGLANKLGGSAATSDGLVDLLAARQSRPGAKSVILAFDGLDEALDGEARERIARDLVKKLAVTCGRLRVTVVVSCRSGIGGSENEALIAALGARCEVIRVDQSPYVRPKDIAEFVESRLLGDDMSPYLGQEEAAAAVAAKVAEAAFPVFLVAQLVVRSLLDDPVETISSLEARRFPREVHEAFDEYLARFGSDRPRVVAALRALSHARGAGFTRSQTWVEVASLLSESATTNADLDWVLGSAASFLIEAVDDRGERRYRLYHQSLIDYFARPGDATAVYRLLASNVADGGFDIDGDYILNHLPGHAAAAGALEELLLTPTLLGHCKASAVVRASARSDSMLGETAARARVAISTVSDLIDNAASVGERLALYSFAGLQHGVEALLQSEATTWWQVVFASWEPISEHRVLLRGSPVTCVSSELIDDQRMIVVGTGQGKLLFIEPETSRVRADQQLSAGITAVASCRTGPVVWMALGLESGDVLLARVLNGQTDLTRVARMGSPLTAVAIRPRRNGGLILAAGTYSGGLLVQERPSRGRISTRRADRSSAIAAVVFMSDLTIAVATSRGSLQELYTETLQRMHGEPADAEEGVVGLAVLPERDEGYRPVVGASGSGVGLWELEFGMQLGFAPLPGATAFGSNPDEPGEIVVGAATRVHLLYVDSAGVVGIGEYAGHEDRVSSVAVFSESDSEAVVSASDDGTVRLWPVAACLPPGEESSGAAIRSVCFDASGARFAMLDELGSVHVSSDGGVERLNVRRVDHIGFVGDALVLLRSGDATVLPSPRSVEHAYDRNLGFTPSEVIHAPGVLVLVGYSGRIAILGQTRSSVELTNWYTGFDIDSASVTQDSSGDLVIATRSTSGRYDFWSASGEPLGVSVDRGIDPEFFVLRDWDYADASWVPFLGGPTTAPRVLVALGDRLLILDADRAGRVDVPLGDHAHRTGSLIAGLPWLENRALLADGRSLRLVDADGAAVRGVELGGGRPFGLWVGRASGQSGLRFALSAQSGVLVGSIDISGA